MKPFFTIYPAMFGKDSAPARHIPIEHSSDRSGSLALEWQASRFILRIAGFAGAVRNGAFGPSDVVFHSSITGAPIAASLLVETWLISSRRTSEERAAANAFLSAV